MATLLFFRNLYLESKRTVDVDLGHSLLLWSLICWQQIVLFCFLLTKSIVFQLNLTKKYVRHLFFIPVFEIPWTEWTDWSKPLATCGSIYHERTRKCDSVPGEEWRCKGSHVQVELINTIPCPSKKKSTINSTKTKDCNALQIVLN